MSSATLTILNIDKRANISVPPPIRETCQLQLSGYGQWGCDNLRIVVMLDDITVAVCNVFDVNYIGQLDLNTVEIVAAFADNSDNYVKHFWWYVFTIANPQTLVECRLPIQNHALLPSQANPTPVEQVINWADIYTKGDVDAKFVQKKEDGAMVRFVNGMQYVYIAAAGLWYPVTGIIQDTVPTPTLGEGVTDP